MEGEGVHLTEEYKVQRWLIWTGKMFVPTTQPLPRAVDVELLRFLTGTYGGITILN